MTNYYYDDEQKLLAIDTEPIDVRILEPIDFEEDEEPAPKRGQAVKISKARRKPGEGCPECCSKARHRKECSKATGGKGSQCSKEFETFRSRLRRL